MEDEFMAKDIERLEMQATIDLRSIVDKFNRDLAAWEARTRCKATFRWNYSHEGAKSMCIQEILHPVYREPVPDELVSEVINKMREASPVQVRPK